MKDTRVETANEGTCIIILFFPRKQMTQQIAKLCGSKRKTSQFKFVKLISRRKKIRQKGTGKYTMQLKMQICFCENRSYSFLSARSDKTGKRIYKSSFILKIKSKLTSF
jgi:hypothetical protein